MYLISSILVLAYINLALVTSQSINSLNYNGLSFSGNNFGNNNNNPSRGSTCQNPFGKIGICIPISECPPLLQILEKLPHEYEAIKFLQFSTTACGFPLRKSYSNNNGGSDEYHEPNVCCVQQSSSSNNFVQQQQQQQQQQSNNLIRPPGTAQLGDTAEAASLRNLNLFMSGNEEAKLRIHRNFGLLPQANFCGHSHEPSKLFSRFRIGKTVSPKITGGQNAPLGKYPWIVLLGVKEEGYEDTQYPCGGTIINRRYILTAAHCAQLHNGFKLSTVRVGEFDTSRNIDCDETECAPPSVDIPVEQVIVHKEYSINGHEHDIALIRLSQNIEFNTFRSPICLPLTPLNVRSILNDGVDQSMPMVAGWGRTKTDVEDGATILQHVSVPLVQQQTCNNFYKGRLRKADIGNARFCAGGVINKDSCKGDSGGPLMVSLNNKSTQMYQIGIVSLGPESCGAENEPAMYTKVSMHLDWILDNLKP